jgi:hypothetical protein
MSEIKVNKISPRTACGTTTLGDSGDTFTIPAGVTITNNGTANGFGATGAVNWQTTVKTGTFTAVAGEGYFVDTTSGGFNVNLPAGTAGAVVGFKDYANTFDTGNLTLVQNGSDKIGGSTVNAVLQTEGLAVTLVFIDSTQGWLVTDSGLQSEAPTAQYIQATGGTAANTPCGNFKTHTFTGPGTFTVCSAGNSAGSNTIEYLVVAGGGGAAGGSPGAVGSGGGGAGGFRFAAPTLAPLTYPAKPLAGPAALPVTATGYPVTVGGGGAGSPASPPSNTRGTAGVNSVFAGTTTITSAGGGGGGADSGQNAGGSGGSGGGGSNSGGAGTGNSPPVTPAQGKDGGTGVGTSTPGWGAAGGGGAICAGQAAQGSNGGYGGDGGGLPLAFGANGVPCGSYRYYAGGGGGGAGYAGGSQPAGAGGKGGGGAGKNGAAGPTTGNAGTTNSGGGGGGIATNSVGGTGGSGIVVIRYKFQN